MKTMLAHLLLTGMLFSMAVSKVENKKNTDESLKSTAKTAAKLQSLDGWISDEKCGAKVDAECAKKCQDKGVKMVFVGADKTILPVANQDALKGFAGQYVNVKGKLEKGVLTVDKITAAAK